ncbi:MAG: riboflavin synthase, partial [Polyangiaceae bacterium]
MFTGLIEATGTLAARTARGAGARLTLHASLATLEREPLVLGESIAVDGACLTVDAVVNGGFEVDASGETLARTTLGRLAVGGKVHLERAMRPSDRLGGHIVTGHVDGVGSLAGRRPEGGDGGPDGSWCLSFAMPAELARFVAVKGSIAVDGVSLTVNGATADRFEITIIPHTARKTKLGSLAVGAPVNLEVDLVARYVDRLTSVVGWG